MEVKNKQDEYLQKLMEPLDPAGNPLAFVSSEAKNTYQSRINRIHKALRLKEADRVPVTLFPSMFPVHHYGITIEEAMYDYEKCVDAFRKYTLQFPTDLQWGAAGPGPGKFYEILDYKLYAWPGHGVAPNHSYQCREGEYMKAEDYDLLLRDPSLFFRNAYLPRVFGSLGGFSMLPPPTSLLEMYGLAFSFIPYGLPPVQQTFKALFDAGAEALKWAGAVGALDGELAAQGIPSILGGFTKAPFDALGDTLRGTKGIMLDMFRRPDTLLKALDVITPIMINMGIASAQQTGNPLIFIPLHKGADGFLSDDQYRKFYWPSLLKVIEGLIEAGCIPFPAAEGSYNTRLEFLKELPKGKTIWMFGQTDVFKIKEMLGDTLCIFGNVPSSTLELGTPGETETCVKKLIDKIAPGGGFILANGSFFDNAKPENLEILIKTAHEYGKY